MRPSAKLAAAARGEHPADLAGAHGVGEPGAVTSDSLPEKPPIAATSAPSMTCVPAPDWEETAIVPPPWARGVGERLGERGAVAAEHAAAARAAAGCRPAVAGRCAGRRPPRSRAAGPPPPGPPPMPAVCGPPAGNVPLVAWPSVCADHAAGAISSAPTRRAERDRPLGQERERRGGRDAGGDQQRRQPARASRGCRAGSPPRRRRPASTASGREHAGGRAALGELRGAGADERGGERRQQRDVVRVEDPLREGERDGGGQERAADGDQPARAGVGAAQAARGEHGDAGDEREAEEPAGLAAHALVEQAQPAGLAAEHAAAARPAARRVAARARRPGR